MDRLSVLINPAGILGEPSIAGTNIPTSTIASEVWEGFSLSDMCLMHERLNAHAIFNACWFESTYGSIIWRNRWRSWKRYATPFLINEDIEYLALPPQKLQYLHNPYSLICEFSVNVYKHIKAI